MTDERRGAIRIPVEGWDAEILKGNDEPISAKIANMSVDGIYLLTPYTLEHGSNVNVLIKSPLLYFRVKAMVVRTKSDGIGFYFLNMGSLSKAYILDQVSRFLTERTSEYGCAA